MARDSALSAQAGYCSVKCFLKYLQKLRALCHSTNQENYRCFPSYGLRKRAASKELTH